MAQQINPKVLAALKAVQAAKRKPIVVTNPNDPRLKAYQDSLGLYNANEQARGGLENRIRSATKEFGIQGIYRSPVMDQGVLLPPKEVVVKRLGMQDLPVQAIDKTVYKIKGDIPDIDPIAYNVYNRRFGSHSVMGTNKQVTLPFNKDREELVAIGQYKPPQQPVVLESPLPKKAIIVPKSTPKPVVLQPRTPIPVPAKIPIKLAPTNIAPTWAPITPALQPVPVTPIVNPVMKENVVFEKPIPHKTPKAIMPRRQGGWSKQPLLMRLFPHLYAKY